MVSENISKIMKASIVTFDIVCFWVLFPQRRSIFRNFILEGMEKEKKEDKGRKERKGIL